MGDCKNGTIAKKNLITTVIWLVKREIIEVWCYMVCGTTVQKPLICQKRRCHGHIRSWLPWCKGIGWWRRTSPWYSVGGVRSELQACPSTVTMNPTELIATIVRSRTSLILTRERLLRLTRRVATIVGAWITVVVVIGGVARRTILNRIYSDRSLHRSISSCQLYPKFMIEHTLINFRDGWRSLTAFNLVNDRLVFFRQSSDDVIKLCGKTLNVRSDREGPFFRFLSWSLNCRMWVRLGFA